MELIIIFAIGIVVGSIITRMVTKPLDFGTLRIDTSDPDGPFMFLELSKDVDAVASKENNYGYYKKSCKNEIYLSHKYA